MIAIGAKEHSLPAMPCMPSLENICKLKLTISSNSQFQNHKGRSIDNHLRIRLTDQIEVLNQQHPFNHDSLVRELAALGSREYKKKNIREALVYYSVLDSLYQSNKIVYSELKEVYDHLYTIAKRLENKNLELQNIRKLLEVDSLLSRPENYLNQRISDEYDIERLKRQQEDLVLQLEQNDKRSSLINGLYILLLLFIIWTIHMLRNNLNQYERESTFSNSYRYDSVKNNKLELPTSIKLILLKKLDFFEKSKGFLNPNIKQEDMAKEFGTNSTYLSIVINREKNMNFSNYLNSLRIRYLLELLEEDSKYYNFKLAALANITGFNNTTSFTNAFFKETGLPASKYLKDRIYNLDKLQYARS